MKLLKKTAVLGLSTLVMSSSMVAPLQTAIGNTPATSETDTPPTDAVTQLLSQTPKAAPRAHLSPDETATYEEAYRDAWKRAMQQQNKQTRLTFLKKLFVPRWFSKQDAVAAIAKSVPLSPVTQVNEALQTEAKALPEATPATTAEASSATQQPTPDKIIPANPAMDEMQEALSKLIEKNAPPVTDKLQQAADTVEKVGAEVAKKIEAITRAADEKSLVVVNTSDEMSIPAPLKQGKEAFTLLSSGLEGLQELDEPTIRTSKVAVPKTPWNHRTPTLDNGAPAIIASTADSVVLKSGISKNISTLDLTMGKAKVLHLSKAAARVSISDPDVASAVVISPTQIQLVGKKVGVANLLVWSDMDTANHTVVDINVHRDVSVLARQMQFIDPGIEIVPMAAEDTVILTGEARNRESAQLAVEMAKAYFAKGGGGVGIAGALGGGDSGGGGKISSNAPGSAIPGSSTNLINLIKVKGEPSTKLELVRKRLKEIDPHVEIEVVPGSDGSEKVVLTGRVVNANTASKIINLASVFYGQPGLKVVAGPGGNAPKALQPGSGDDQSGGGSGGGGGSPMGAMGGSASGSASANMLQGAVVTDASGNVISLMEIAQKPQIRCTVKFLEIRKTGLDAIGTTLMGGGGTTNIASLSGNQSPHGSKPLSSLAPNSSYVHSGSAGTGDGAVVAGTSAGTVASALSQVLNNGTTHVLSFGNQLQATLQLLEEKRVARTLAEPTLTMLSGEQSSFLAGGEVPIPMIGGNGQIEVEYHQVGIRLNMAASVTDDGKIHLEVEPEVSAVDQAFGTSTNFGSLPGFKTRRTHSTVQIEPGQSFVMAGLYNQEDVDSISGLPGVSKLPILGNFFRNKWNERSKTELVVIIQPEVLMNQDAMAGNYQPVRQQPAKPSPYRASR